MSETVADQVRIEEDALGDVQVPGAHLWGAQTERSRLNFPIGVERFRWGRPVIRALGILKKCAAIANGELDQLPKEKVDLIVRAAQEVIDGRLDPHFPVDIYQTGSHQLQESVDSMFDLQNRPTAAYGAVQRMLSGMLRKATN